jgi:hypothetical protein
MSNFAVTRLFTASYPSRASVSEAWGGWQIESAANDVTGGGC